MTMALVLSWLYLVHWLYLVWKFAVVYTHHYGIK